MLRRAYHDPRFMILLLLLIVISGISGFTTRPKLEDPKSKVRKGQITTYLPGASPSEIESLITEPIEKALREAKAIRAIESSSLRGVSIVFVRLTDEVVDVSESWAKIQDKLSEVTGSFPDRASIPTLVDERRWDPYTTVVALIDTTESSLQSAVLARWAKELENRLRFVSGTRFTELFGLPEEEILVEVTEETIANIGITLAEIAKKIQQRDSEAPDATSQTLQFNMPVRLAGGVDDLDRLRNVVLRGTSKGNLLRLKDIATVRRTEKLPVTTSSFVNGKRAVVIGTRMDTNYIIDSWTARQTKALEEFAKTLPAGLSMELLFTQKQYTDERSNHLYGSLGLGMVFVIIVVWLMMGWRAAIPICAAIPLTLLGVFFLMIPFAVSLHQMSIAGLILALGMLIDNPIIMVDEIQRRSEAGESTENAIMNSVNHLMRPLVGSNLTTILGFTPILLIPGTTGEYLGQLGWAVIACLTISLILSLSVVPVLAAWCLGPRKQSFVTPQQTEGHYVTRLEWFLKRPWLTVSLSILLPVMGFAVSGELEEQFFPQAERDHFHFSVRLPTQASIRSTERVALKARDLILEHSEVEDVSLFIGTNAPAVHYSMFASDENRPEFAQGIVGIRSGKVEPDFVRQIQHELNSGLPEAQSIAILLEQGPPTVAPIEFRIYGPSIDQLSELGEVARKIMMEIPGIVQTRSTLDLGGPQLALNVRQHDAESLDITDEILAHQVSHQLDGIILTTMSEQIEEVPVRVRIEGGDKSEPERVFSLPVISPKGELVPLGSVADWSIGRQLFNIPRRNSSRCNIIQGYVAAGELPIVLENKFKKAIAESGFALPLGYRSDFGGVSQERNSAVGNLLAYAAIIEVLMLSVLVITFRSFRQAGIIGVVAILSLGLGLLSLWLFNFPMGLMAIIGLLGMMGLAINDSIVVLTDAKQAILSGKTVTESVVHSTRHVLTTSITTAAGVSPLVMAGGEFWPPMMVVIAGGVLGATFLALGLTPALYIITSRKMI